jgi:hypothetical protein
MSTAAEARAKNKAAMQRIRTWLHTGLSRNYSRKTYRIFQELLKVTPQYSGEFVSNWVMSRSSQVGGVIPWASKGSGSVVEKGDPSAIFAASARALGTKFDYRYPVYFVNPVPLSFTATTVTGTNTQNLRGVNLLSPAIQVLSYIKFKYGAR